MATATLKTLIEKLCDEYGIGRYVTNTGTSAASITADATLGGSDGARKIDAGCAVYVTGGSSGSAPDDEETRLASRPKLATGGANLDPNLTVALANNDTAAIAYKPLTWKAGSGPNAIIPTINEVLTMFPWEKRIPPLTDAADGDMISTATSDWTASNATLSKVVATHPLGERVLRVTATSADGYARTGSIAVEPSKSYYLEVTGMIASTGAAADEGTLILYDVTGASETTHTLSNKTIDRFEPEILANNITTGASVEQVQIYLRAEANTDVIDWSNLIFRKNEARVFTLTDRPQRVMQVGQVRATNNTTWSNRTWNNMRQVDAEAVQIDGGLWQIHLGESVSGQAVFYEEYLTPATLSVATDTTTIPAEYLAPVAAEKLLRPLRFERAWAPMYDKAKQESAGVIDAYMAHTRSVINTTPKVYPRVRV